LTKAGGAVSAAELAATEEKTRLVLKLVSRSLLRIILITLAVYFLIKGAFWIVYALTGVLLLVVLAIFFAYLVAPLVEIVRRPLNVRGRVREVPRLAAIAIVYVAIFGSLLIVVQLLTPRLSAQVTELTKQAQVYASSARKRAERLNEIYARLNLPPEVRASAQSTVERAINEASGYVAGQSFHSIITLLGYIPWLVLVPILAFFLLKDADSFRRSALQMLPQGRLRWRGDEFFQDVNSTLAAYIRAQLIACLIIGIICTIGFYVIGMPYALVLGVMAGVFEFIPLLGPLLVALVVVAVASFDPGDPVNKVIAVIIFLGVLRIIHDYWTYPRIIGSGIHLHPLAVILAILSGHEVAGITGIFLAIPMIAVLTVTYRHWLEHRGSQGLVADILKPAEQVVTEPAREGEKQSPAPAVNQPTPSDA
jgi:predicted PurR-regulated permease PerM